MSCEADVLIRPEKISRGHWTMVSIDTLVLVCVLFFSLHEIEGGPSESVVCGAYPTGRIRRTARVLVAGLHPGRIFDDAYREFVHRIIEQITIGLTSARAFERRSRRDQDGTYRWHLQRAVVLHDAEGKLLRFVGTTTNIDDLKRAEEKLRESERESRLIVDSIPGLVALMSPSGALEAVNRHLLEYFGQSLEELRGWGTNDTIHPDAAATGGTDIRPAFYDETPAAPPRP